MCQNLVDVCQTHKITALQHPIWAPSGLSFTPSWDGPIEPQRLPIAFAQWLGLLLLWVGLLTTKFFLPIIGYCVKFLRSVREAVSVHRELVELCTSGWTFEKCMSGQLLHISLCKFYICGECVHVFYVSDPWLLRNWSEKALRQLQV